METINIIIYAASIALFPALIWMLIVGLKVRSTFKKYDRIASASRVSGGEAARCILDHAGLQNIGVERVAGTLTDHYDPRDKTVYLSEATCDSVSVAALGIAAHEVGHAIQESVGYAPLKLRTAMVPAISFSSRIAFPLIILGIILELFLYTSNFAYYVILTGIVFYAAYTVFTLVTLPVEYNASKRAKNALTESGILSSEETAMAGEVLGAAAKTYLAAFVVSLLQLLRLLTLIGRRR